MKLKRRRVALPEPDLNNVFHGASICAIAAGKTDHVCLGDEDKYNLSSVPEFEPPPVTMKPNAIR